MLARRWVSCAARGPLVGRAMSLRKGRDDGDPASGVGGKRPRSRLRAAEGRHMDLSPMTCQISSSVIAPSCGRWASRLTGARGGGGGVVCGGSASTRPGRHMWSTWTEPSMDRLSPRRALAPSDACSSSRCRTGHGADGVMDVFPDCRPVLEAVAFDDGHTWGRLKDPVAEQYARTAPDHDEDDVPASGGRPARSGAYQAVHVALSEGPGGVRRSLLCGGVRRLGARSAMKGRQSKIVMQIPNSRTI